MKQTKTATQLLDEASTFDAALKATRWALLRRIVREIDHGTVSASEARDLADALRALDGVACPRCAGSASPPSDHAMRQDVLKEFVAAASWRPQPATPPPRRVRSLHHARALAFLGVKLDLSLDLDVRCTSCDAERTIPGKAERVLTVDGATYAEFDEPCERCGARRVRLKVQVDDGCEAEHEGRPPPTRGRR